MDNYKKRRVHDERRKSSHVMAPHVEPSKTRLTTAPLMRRAKSGDQLRERRPRSQTALTTPTDYPVSKIPRPARPPSQTFTQSSTQTFIQQPSMEKALSKLKSLEQMQNLPRKIISQQDVFRREKKYGRSIRITVA